jgi:hypothetical protein
MSLSTKLAGNFTKNVRKRGDDYYCKGRVMIHEGSQSELTACVRGSGFYEVQFAWRNNKLAVWCDVSRNVLILSHSSGVIAFRFCAPRDGAKPAPWPILVSRW